MIDQDSFRLGMRYLAAGVNVIATTDQQGERYGMTATAVCSVCADPPTLLVCVNRRNSTLEPLIASGFYSVNVLGMPDRSIADRFATPMEASEKFQTGDWRSLETGAPVLQTALVSFECKVSQTLSVGTHEVIFGEIQAVHVSSAAHGPLLYGHGAYGALASVSVPEKQILNMLSAGQSCHEQNLVPIADLLSNDPKAQADIEFATQTRAVRPLTKDGLEYLNTFDAQVVSLIGLARAEGTIDDAGLSPEDYAVYVEAAEMVADKEFKRLQQAQQQLDTEAMAHHTHRGLEVANLLFGTLHTSAILRRVAAQSANTPE